MPLARRAQAKDEAQFSIRKAVLIRVRHDRRVEQRGCLQGIFAGEERADIELSRLGQRAAAEDVRPDLLKVLPPNHTDVGMAAAEVGQDGGKLLLGLGLAQSQRASNDIHDARRITGNEWSNQNP